MPSGLRGPVSLHFAPTTKLVKLDSPYSRFTKGASGKYDGDVVHVTGTTIGLRGPGEPGGEQPPVRAVQGKIVVARTMPGRMLPTGEPTPGKLSAWPKVLPTEVGGPSVALKPGNPNMPPI